MSKKQTLPDSPILIQAGAALVQVTEHQSSLIARLSALRSSLWGVTDPQTAADFSMNSARAWRLGDGPVETAVQPTLAQRLHALAAIVHELEEHLGVRDDDGGPVFTWKGARDAHQAARTLVFDLAVEAGRVDHAEGADAAPAVVILPPPTGPVVVEEP